MKSLFITSEAVPFAASGGLGDVAGALPAALRGQGIDCRVVLPLYEDLPLSLRAKLQFAGSFSVPLAWRRQYCGVFTVNINGVPYYLLDNEYYFKRPGLYGHYDDAERFAFFAKAVLELLPVIDFFPDILHANDWQTALVPVYHALQYHGRPGYEAMKTVFTLHNIQYQGQYDCCIGEDVLGLGSEQATLLHYDGCINFLKGGIEASDRVTTVSPTYAQELNDPYFAYGLADFWRQRSDKCRGILNGIDTDLYNPAADSLIAAPFSAGQLAGKAANKKALQEQFGLPVQPHTPLIGMVSRLVEQKGFDLILYALENLLKQNIQIAVLGAGDWRYEHFLKEAAARYPQSLSVRTGFYPAVARQLYAGADLFLMPSKTEPCGLAQLIAKRYGALPIVRATGGLKDTVTDCGGEGGNGFTFQTYNAEDMSHAVWRAVAFYRNQPEAFGAAVVRAMECDHSWQASALAYKALYEEVVAPCNKKTIS